VSLAFVTLGGEPEMADRTLPRAKITITLSGHLMLELAQMACEAETTEDELVNRAITCLVQAHRGPGIPRFARRLGPLALAEGDPSAA
jgi:hypothetical protein